MKTTMVVACVCLAVHCMMAPVHAQELRATVDRIALVKHATVGVAILGPQPDDTVFINPAHHCVMQSVYKFHLALNVMNRVDEGTLSLEQKIHIDKADLPKNTWSPLRDAHPKGNVDLTLREILRYTVAQSDNIGCDLLFRLLGGTAVVNDYIHGLGVRDVSIAATEAEMHAADSVQYTNWTTAPAAARLMAEFHAGRILSPKSTAILREILEQTSTGPKRLKGLLPKGTVVAHKTGSSGADEKGFTAALNDIGVITLPDGSTCVVAVFVNNSRGTEEKDERIIAEIARAAWDYFSARPPAH